MTFDGPHGALRFGYSTQPAPPSPTPNPRPRSSPCAAVGWLIWSDHSVSDSLDVMWLLFQNVLAVTTAGPDCRLIGRVIPLNTDRWLSMTI